MKNSFCCVMIAVLNWATPAQAQQQGDVEAASTSAQQWLAVSDAQQYAATYTDASSVLRQAISQELWVQTIQSSRKPLGKLQHRTVKSATFKKDLPGAPAGEFLIIEFSSVFDNYASAKERVVTIREANGWKVAGYHVK